MRTKIRTRRKTDRNQVPQQNEKTDRITLTLYPTVLTYAAGG